MSSGCQHCSPYCDFCKPSVIKPYACPRCEHRGLFTKAQILSGKPLLCEKCEEDLTERFRPDVVLCKFSGLPCAYPCQRSKRPTPDLGHRKCGANTPPNPEQQDQ